MDGWLHVSEVVVSSLQVLEVVGDSQEAVVDSVPQVSVVLS